MHLNPTELKLLQLFYEEPEKNRQKHELAAKLETTPDYISARLTRLRELGLIKLVNPRFGWWKLSPAGTKIASEEPTDEPFFTEHEVSANSLLNSIAQNYDFYKDAALKVNDEVLQFLVGVYLAKKGYTIPIGRRIHEEEWFTINQVTTDLMLHLEDVSSRFYYVAHKDAQ